MSSASYADLWLTATLTGAGCRASNAPSTRGWNSVSPFSNTKGSSITSRAIQQLIKLSASANSGL